MRAKYLVYSGLRKSRPYRFLPENELEARLALIQPVTLIEWILWPSIALVFLILDLTGKAHTRGWIPR